MPHSPSAPTPIRFLPGLLTLLALAAIAVLTLHPRPELEMLAAATPLWCLVCGSVGTVDVILNVLLFTPFGLGLGLLGVRTGRAVLTGAAVSLAVEVLQITVVPGRDASLSDLLTNTLGTFIGVLVARYARRILDPAPGTARRLAWAAAAAAVAILAFTAYAIAPRAPDGPYWGQWTPELGGFEQHPGAVLSAVVEEIDAPSRRILESPELRERLGDGEHETAVTAVLAGRTPAAAPIFRLVNRYGHQVLLTAQDGEDLLVEAATRAAGLRLRPLTIRVPQALAGSASGPDTVQIRIGVTPARYRAEAVGRVGSTLQTVWRSPAWGWALLLPVPGGIGPRSGLFDALWLALLLLPAGYYAARARAPSAAGAVAGAVGLGLGAVPLLFGLPAPAATTWAGAVAGALAGALLAAAMTRTPFARSARVRT